MCDYSINTAYGVTIPNADVVNAESWWLKVP